MAEKVYEASVVLPLEPSSHRDVLVQQFNNVIAGLCLSPSSLLIENETGGIMISVAGTKVSPT